jgi:hypothetical protein
MVRGEDLPVLRELGRHLDPPNFPVRVAKHAPLEVLLLEVCPADVSLRSRPVEKPIRFGQALETIPYPYRVGTPVDGDDPRRAAIRLRE